MTRLQLIICVACPRSFRPLARSQCWLRLLLSQPVACTCSSPIGRWQCRWLACTEGMWALRKWTRPSSQQVTPWGHLKPWKRYLNIMCISVLPRPRITAHYRSLSIYKHNGHTSMPSLLYLSHASLEVLWNLLIYNHPWAGKNIEVVMVSW